MKQPAQLITESRHSSESGNPDSFERLSLCLHAGGALKLGVLGWH